ncbi:unnamed protein product, partial [marine sediment metagenome]
NIADYLNLPITIGSSTDTNRGDAYPLSNQLGKRCWNTFQNNREGTSFLQNTGILK